MTGTVRQRAAGSIIFTVNNVIMVGTVTPKQNSTRAPYEIRPTIPISLWKPGTPRSASPLAKVISLTEHKEASLDKFGRRHLSRSTTGDIPGMEGKGAELQTLKPQV